MSTSLLLKLVSGATIATLTIGGVIYSGATNLGNAKADTSKLVNKIGTLKGSMSTLDGILKDKNALLLKYDGTVTTNKADYIALEALRAGLASQISDLNAQKVLMDAQIAKLQQDIIDGNAGSLADQLTITALQDKLNELEASITTANNEAQAMEDSTKQALVDVGTTGDTAIDTSQYKVTLANDTDNTPPPTVPTIGVTKITTTNEAAFKGFVATQYYTTTKTDEMETQLRTLTGDATLELNTILFNGNGGYEGAIHVDVTSTKTNAEVQTIIDGLKVVEGNEWFVMQNNSNGIKRVDTVAITITVQ